MKPRIFIGSSSESKALAEAIRVNLNNEAHCTVWTDAFPLSRNTIDALLDACAENDFAIFVFSDDDVSRMRSKEHKVTRDNVVLESGLFMGMYGKERVYVVVPQNIEQFHIPTDFLGLTTADYDVQFAKRKPNAGLGAATTKIKEAIAQSSWANLKLDVSAYGSLNTDPGITYPLKLSFRIANNQRDPVAIDSMSFEVGPSLRAAANASDFRIPGTNTFKMPLLIGKVPVKEELKDHYVDRCVVEPQKSVKAWMAIDPGKDPKRELAVVNRAIESKAAGTWRYRCYWLGSRVTVRDYEDRF